MGDSLDEKVSSWLARIIAADNWKPSPSTGSKVSSSTIDFMDMCTQLLELSINSQGDELSESSSPSSHSSPSSPLPFQELVKRADPEVREKLSEVIVRYCRLVSRSMCEGLIYGDIEHVHAHMVSCKKGRKDGNERKRHRRKRAPKVKVVVPGPLPPECCIKCNDIERIAYWAAENELCTEEDQDLLMEYLREAKAFLSSWCAVYPCHVVRRALKWRAMMKPALRVGEYLDTQLCAIVGDLVPRIFTGVAARVWDDIMQETIKYTKAWNKRRGRKIVMTTFNYFYAGGDGLSARALESSSSFQKLKEYLKI